MATKPNIRSIRFSDELAELIDRQAGNTFTEKFENLVTCGAEQPQGDGDGGQEAALPLDHPLQLLGCGPQHLQTAVFPRLAHDREDRKSVV